MFILEVDYILCREKLFYIEYGVYVFKILIIMYVVIIFN